MEFNMPASPSAASTCNSGSLFSSMIKKWRKLRKLSQLDLSLDAGVSQRHISFLESGRAQPSKAMVLCLSKALSLSLREQNLLLHAAGFTHSFKERPLDDEEMKSVQHALTLSLKHHEPYPAIVVDRNWNLVMKNNAADKLIAIFGDPEDFWLKVDPTGDKNIYRMTFHPQGLQAFIKNWDELARHLLHRLQMEVNADPTNEALNHLLSDVTVMSGVNSDNIHPLKSYSTTPVLPMEMGNENFTLKLFSMISSFGTAMDVTAEELKIETFFPADEFTTQFFKQMTTVS
jgi:transcriptional regulator with XRE-family HTH domain